MPLSSAMTTFLANKNKGCVRVCTLRKSRGVNSFGFAVHCKRGRTGNSRICVVCNVFADSPAERSGVRCGDHILAIDEVNVFDEPYKAIVERLKAARELTSVKLLVADPETFTEYAALGLPMTAPLPGAVVVAEPSGNTDSDSLRKNRSERLYHNSINEEITITSQTDNIIYCFAAEFPKEEEIPSTKHEKASQQSPKTLFCPTVTGRALKKQVELTKGHLQKGGAAPSAVTTYYSAHLKPAQSHQPRRRLYQVFAKQSTAEPAVDQQSGAPVSPASELAVLTRNCLLQQQPVTWSPSSQATALSTIWDRSLLTAPSPSESETSSLFCDGSLATTLLPSAESGTLSPIWKVPLLSALVTSSDSVVRSLICEGPLLAALSTCSELVALSRTRSAIGKRARLVALSNSSNSMRPSLICKGPLLAALSTSSASMVLSLICKGPVLVTLSESVSLICEVPLLLTLSRSSESGTLGSIREVRQLVAMSATSKLGRLPSNTERQCVSASSQDVELRKMSPTSDWQCSPSSSPKADTVMLSLTCDRQRLPALSCDSQPGALLPISKRQLCPSLSPKAERSTPSPTSGRHFLPSSSSNAEPVTLSLNSERQLLKSLSPEAESVTMSSACDRSVSPDDEPRAPLPISEQELFSSLLPESFLPSVSPDVEPKTLLPTSDGQLFPSLSPDAEPGTTSIPSESQWGAGSGSYMPTVKLIGSPPTVRGLFRCCCPWRIKRRRFSQ